MALAGDLKKEIVEWGILGMVIVIFSVILLTMRETDSIACASGFYNKSLNLCCTNGTVEFADKYCALNATPQSLYNDLGTYVSAFSEPKSWIVIIIIGIIGMALIGYFKKKQ